MVQARQEGQGEIVLCETPDGKTARKYWSKLKERLGKEGKNYLTDVATAKPSASNPSTSARPPPSTY